MKLKLVMSARATSGKAWIVVVIALALVTAIVIAWILLVWSRPYRHPELYLPDIERASRPLIEAIDAHTKRVGTPPNTLKDLLPEFDASKVETAYPPQRHFEYHVWRKRVPEDTWALILYTELLSLDSDVIEYDSVTRTWESKYVR